MDFSRLGLFDLKDFLSFDYLEYGIYPDYGLSQINQAEKLFEQVALISFELLPLAIRDLYLATIYDGSLEEFYTVDQIMNLTPGEIERFALEFGFDPEELEPQILRESFFTPSEISPLDMKRIRIFRILNFLERIDFPEKILLQGELLSRFCSQLSAKDLNNFRIAFDLIEISCLIPINDKDHQIKYFNKLNDKTWDLIYSIEMFGSKDTFIKSALSIRQMKVLLDLGMNPNVTDRMGSTALMMASRFRHLDSIRLLIEYGADPLIRRRHDDTALSEAGSLDIVKYLLNFNFEPQDIGHALIAASGSGYLDIVKFLFQRNIPLTYKSEALLEASKKGKIKIMEFLINQGLDINMRGGDRVTPLMLASSGDHLEAVELLLAYKANFTLQNQFGRTALFYTLDNKTLDIAQILLDHGADLNLRNNYGGTVLMEAVQGRNVPLVGLLLEYKANPNIQDNQKNTLLMTAVHTRSLPLIELLLKYGADPNLQNNNGQSALTVARELGNPKIINLLEQA